MKYPSILLCICLAFFTTLFSGPALASKDDVPRNCPYPSYTGCKRYVSYETNYRIDPGKDGNELAGGGSPTRYIKEIIKDVHGNELFISYGSVIHDETGANYADIYGGAAPGASNVYNNSAYLLAGSEGRDVYGGYSKGGSVSLNKVEVNASTAHKDVVGGKSESVAIGATVKNNRVYLSNSTRVEGDAIGGLTTGDGVVAALNEMWIYNDVHVKGNVYGGRAEGNGEVSQNRVSVTTGSSVGKSVYGGYSDGAGRVVSNTASVHDSEVTEDLVGGYSKSGAVIGNSATLHSGKVLGGEGVIGGLSNSGTVEGNTASVLGGEVTTDVRGGYIRGPGAVTPSIARDNQALVSGGHIIGSVTGALVEAPGDAINNLAQVSGSGSVPGDVTGGIATGSAIGNRALVSGWSVDGNVTGGQGDIATGNSAVTLDAAVSNNIIGGYAGSGAATGNTAIMDGGSASNLYGGAASADSTNNAVALYSGNVSSDVIGGQSSAGNAASTVNNTVSLYGGSIGGRVIGGSNDLTYTGNTLNLRGFYGRIPEVKNFQNYSLMLPAALGPGSTLLSVTNAPVDLSKSWVTSFSLDPTGTQYYQVGDTFTLIDNTTGAGHINVVYPNLAKGISSLYSIRVLGQANTLIAAVEETQSNPQSQTLSGPMLSGLTLVNLGADLVAGNALDQAWKTSKNYEESGRWSFFSSFTYEDMSLDNKIDTRGWSYLAGMAWRDGNNNNYGFLGGLFFETGYADYDGSHTYAGVGRAKYDGNVRYYGLGSMARYRLENSLRLEASARFGKVDSDYAASEYAGGQHPSYNLNTWYFGAHAGAGWDVDLMDLVNLDFSAKYFWVRQLGKTVSVGDERVNFKDADSHRLKAGARLTFMAHERCDFFTGAYYEEEFGGDIRANNRSSGHGIDTLDMDGASGVFEAGVSMLPTGSRNLVVDFMLSGSTGTREGFGGHMSLGWNF